MKSIFPYTQLLDYYLACLREEANQGIRLVKEDDQITWRELPLDQEWNQQQNKDIIVPPDFLSAWLSSETTNNLLLYGYPIYVKREQNTDLSNLQLLPVILQTVEISPAPTGRRLRLLPNLRINRDFVDELRRIDVPLTKQLPHTLSSTDCVSTLWRLFNHQDVLPLVEYLEATLPRFDFHAMKKEGFYNRAVLIHTDALTYTHGLEKELNALKQVWEQVAGTALNTLIQDHVPQSKKADLNNKVLQVTALNDEQRQAVNAALTAPFTVVTGPGGCGKSQVILNVLANAWLQGQSVLFAAKTQKAVHVVEERLTSLGHQNVLLRAGHLRGDTALCQELTERIGALLSRPESHEPSNAIFLEYHSLYRQWEDKTYQLEEWLNEAVQYNDAQKLVSDTMAQTDDEYRNWLVKYRFRINPVSVRNALDCLSRWHGSNLGYRQKFSILINLLRIRLCLPYLHEKLTAPSFASLYREPRQWIRWLENLGKAMELASALRCVAQQATRRPLRELVEQVATIEEQLPALGELAFCQAIEASPTPFTRNDPAYLGRYLALLRTLSSQGLCKADQTRLKTELTGLFSKLLKPFPLWSVTNLSAHSALPFAAGVFDLVIIDEGSACDIASALPLLYRARRAMIVGDNMQLRHVCTISNTLDMALQKHHGIDVAKLQHFSYGKNSLFDLALAQPGATLHMLVDHYRCHHEIVGFSNQKWYGGLLRVKTDYARLHPSLPAKGIHWVNVKGDYTTGDFGGIYHIQEAKAVIKLLLSLEAQQFDGSVGVVTPFRAQVGHLQALAMKGVDVRWRETTKLVIDTAHGFQGDEKDVMIITTCLHRTMPRGAQTFLSEHPNLFNVALKRARGLVYVVGDRDAYRHSEIAFMGEFERYVSKIEYERMVQYPSAQTDMTIGEDEKRLWEALYALGIQTIPQYPVDQYRIDLAWVTDRFKMAIEVDGKRYHTDAYGVQLRSDIERDRRLQAAGWICVRVPAKEINENPEIWIQHIIEAAPAPMTTSSNLSLLKSNGQAGILVGR